MPFAPWLVVGGWWLVVGGWWLVVGGWWLVVRGSLGVVGSGTLGVVGCWLLAVGIWQAVALGYVSYLAVVSFASRDFVRARRPLLIAAAVAWAAYAAAGRAPLSPVLL